MPLKTMLRNLLDRTSSAAIYDCGFDDAGDATVQCRLQIPGAEGYRKEQYGNGWIREAEGCGAERSDTGELYDRLITNAPATSARTSRGHGCDGPRTPHVRVHGTAEVICGNTKSTRAFCSGCEPVLCCRQRGRPRAGDVSAACKLQLM